MREQLGVHAVRPEDAVTKHYADTLAVTSMSNREIPTGTVDGLNAVFTLAHTPQSGTETVFMNGLAQHPGVDNDYTISGPTITFVLPPPSGTGLAVTYWFSA